MKSRFSTLDIMSCLTELKEKLVGMRVNQIYDVDHKTYLIRLGKQEEKAVLLMESGIRIHSTEFEWPKNPAPSGFTMKLRKHLKNKRLESIRQVGIDRIVDMQFGINEATYHVILELYDRGNIVLTDGSYMILNILRPRATGSEDVKFLVRETYPIDSAKQFDLSCSVSDEQVFEMFRDAKPNDNLKKILNPKLHYGPSILDHLLLEAGFPLNSQFDREFVLERDVAKMKTVLAEANSLLERANETGLKGYIVLKIVKHILPGVEKETETFEEFHPFLFNQHRDKKILEFETFNKSVDTFFSGIEGQKIDVKMIQREKDAMKKLDNVKKDHEKRVEALKKSQLSDVQRAQLIEMNLPLVDKAILVLRSAVANQISWSDIGSLIKEAQVGGDPAALAIKALKLEMNHFSILLKDPYDETQKPQVIDIDLDLSGYANARKFYNQKRHAAKKEMKTLESSAKAYKNAEKKTKQTLKEVAVVSSIIKARKTFWFEKFQWFISSENYLVIGGRDIQQNELIVKRYMKPGDIYVHADIHGASSVVIKNHPGGGAIPPKTQNEAGTMAVCYSAAWEAKVVTSAWWVYHHQVSKTAPSGEYLTTGSFMIRGKKNYLPPSHLIMGFGFLFKLDEDSIERHAHERMIHAEEEELEAPNEDEELPLDDSDTDNEIPSTNPESTESSFPDTVVRFGVPQRLSESEAINTGVQSNKVKQQKKEPEIVQDETKPSSQSNPKRRQKFKLKKMKEKYKDQDDEERQLRMDILASAGQAKEPKSKKGKKGKESQQSKQTKPTAGVAKPVEAEVQIEPTEEPKTDEITDPSSQTPDDAPPALASPIKEIPDDQVKDITDDQVLTEESKDLAEKSDDEEEEETNTNEELAILNSLSGCPSPDDTLLFSLPFCAPYSALQNFKYKVKMTPGTGKRGKAAKTALAIFLKDRTSTNRERDLLKSVKDQDIARNIPGRVKLSAPNLTKLKK